ncbi:capsular polysaccharide transport system permease protein [Novosphingobium chloroacetimidivorans]|uniref:Capsular polysaccharide transport system permease protein n=1 Tax=Novosphingobium chloroacetimidivorans TaxID=1428314 RepID=A0A7W7KE64_9SPHN|nr:Wzz/FepE/Etk N-terminal domain-containing protein [Novosphingobium chloroacetimidivorans]MBB4860589.1 capsular polysaccharide transport system permease protein [Novosphingobium chloroacetimidivorans]
MRKRRWFVLVVVLPTLLAALYYGFIASDIYVSEARFVIKSPDQKRPQLSTLANLIQTTGLSSGQEQANEVLEFVRSRDALRALEKNAGARSRFAENGDPLSRFPGLFADNSFEEFYKYYGKMVDARLDSESGTAILTVKAFTPDDAFVINDALLNLSEGLVNRLNSRAQNKAIAEAQKQVELASDRARRARTALGGFRTSQEVIDPAKQAAGVLDISNNMVATRAALQAQLDNMQRVTPQNPSIPALRNQINAISVQIASQDSRVVGSGQGIASKMGGYEDLYVEQEFATENLNAANAALVQARNEAQRQQFYLERIVEANKPDTPVLPRRLLSVIVIAAALTCLYFVGWMLIVGILEHAPED